MHLSKRSDGGDQLVEVDPYANCFECLLRGPVKADSNLLELSDLGTLR
jgi:hypothetical protein